MEETRSQTNLPFKFTGKELDPETGLYYFGARYYDPQVSVWASADPALPKYLPANSRILPRDLSGLGGVYRPINLNNYGYAGQHPIIYVDPDGNAAFLVGALTGAILDTAAQIVLIQAGIQSEFDFSSVAISAVAGSVGAGLATKINQIQKMNKFVKVGADVFADAAVDMGSKAAKGEEITLEGVILDVATGQAAGKIAGKSARGKAELSSENKLLEKAADRAERIANNPKSSRPEARNRQAEAARRAQQNYLSDAETKAGTIASGAATKMGDTIGEINKNDK